MVANAGEAKAAANAAASVINATAQASAISKEAGSKETAVIQRESKDMPPPRDKATLAGRDGSLQSGGRQNYNAARGGRGRGNERQSTLYPNRVGWGGGGGAGRRRGATDTRTHGSKL